MNKHVIKIFPTPDGIFAAMANPSPFFSVRLIHLQNGEILITHDEFQNPDGEYLGAEAPADEVEAMSADSLALALMIVVEHLHTKMASVSAVWDYAEQASLLHNLVFGSPDAA